MSSESVKTVSNITMNNFFIKYFHTFFIKKYSLFILNIYFLISQKYDFNLI